MSEKLFALLLRLYPAHFRSEYGEDAMQLFHDRLRDERGFLPRLRLWFDLLMDLAFSLPREHRRDSGILAPAHLQSPAGIPAFHILEDQLPRPGSFVVATVFALVALSAFGFLLYRGGTYRFRNSSPEALTAAAGDLAISSEANTEGTYASAPEPILGAAERKRVIAAVIANLKKYYNHPGEDRKIAEQLSTHEKRGDYGVIVSGSDFAALLTRQMGDVTHDKNLVLIFSRRPIPADGPGLSTVSDSREPGTFHRIDDHFGLRIPRSTTVP